MKHPKKEALAALANTSPASQLLQQAQPRGPLPSVSSQVDFGDMELEVHESPAISAAPSQSVTQPVRVASPSAASLSEQQSTGYGRTKRRSYDESDDEAETKARAKLDGLTYEIERGEARLREQQREMELAAQRRREEDERRARERREEDERRAKAQREEDERRAQQRREEEARLKQQRRDAYVATKTAERTTFLNLARANKIQAAATSDVRLYQAAIQSFQAALHVDVRFPEDLNPWASEPIFRDPEQPKILLEIADCYYLTGELVIAYQKLTELYSKLQSYNQNKIVEHECSGLVKSKIAEFKARFIAIGLEHISAAQRCFYDGRHIVDAQEHLVKAEHAFAKVGHKDDAHKIEFLRDAIAWSEIEYATNVNALRLLLAAQTVNELVNVERCERLAAEIYEIMQTYARYKDHLNPSTTDNLRNLQSLQPSVQSRLNNLRLARSWEQSRTRINEKVAKYADLTEKSLETATDFRTILGALRECEEVYRVHRVCLSTQEKEMAASLPAKLDIAQRGFKIQVERERREADRQVNVRTEQEINDLLIVLARNMQTGDLLQALANVKKMQSLADFINYVEDISNKHFKQPGYFAATIAQLETYVGHFNLRAKHNAGTMVRKIIDDAIGMRPAGHGPVLWSEDAAALNSELERIVIANWQKFDRRPVADYVALQFVLAQTIAGDLQHHWMPTRWWYQIDMSLQNRQKLFDILTKIIARHTPTAEVEALPLDLLQAQVVVAPPVAVVADDVPMAVAVDESGNSGPRPF